MPGTGAKLVSLDGDKATHLLAAGERTECGLPIPIGGGATWTYGDRTSDDVDICPDCEKAAEKGAPAEPVKFSEGVYFPGVYFPEVLLPTEVVDDTAEEPKEAKAKSGAKAKA